MNIHVDQGRIPLPLAYPFESRVLALLEIRKEASDEIERLLAIVDAIDGDPDLEPTAGHDSNALRDECEDDRADCEPVLGATEAMIQDFAWGQTYGILDGEEQCEDEAADDDREVDPAESGIGDCDGLVEQLTGEPSLGSLERVANQTVAWKMYSPAFILDGEADHDGCEPEVGY